ncbi:UNVERIFIED_CONTAM: hypothetical protein RMT77_018007 [Armadillidium vulgare]
MEKNLLEITLKSNDDGRDITLYVNEDEYNRIHADDEYAQTVFDTYIGSLTEEDNAEDGNEQEQKQDQEKEQGSATSDTISVMEEHQKEKARSHNKTLLLLASLAEEKENFKRTFTRNKAFLNVHKKFAEHNYKVSVEDIKRKWRNLTRTYRITRDKCKHTGEKKQTWAYYDMVHEIYEEGSRELLPPELVLLDTFTEEKPIGTAAETKHEPCPTTSKKKINFEEYAVESVGILKDMAANLERLNSGISEIAKSVSETNIAIAKLSEIASSLNNNSAAVNKLSETLKKHIYCSPKKK